MCAKAKNHKVHDQAWGGCAATRVGQKVTVDITIHDGMLNIRPNGVGGRYLTHMLWARFGKSATKEALMNQIWGEQSNSNTKSAKKYKGFPSK